MDFKCEIIIISKLPVAEYATLPSSFTSIPDRCNTLEILSLVLRYCPREIPGNEAVSSKACRIPS